MGCFFLKRDTCHTYTTEILFCYTLYLFPKAAPPTFHTTFLFIPCLKNKYPKGILCWCIYQYKRYLWKHYLKCCLKEHLENILLVCLVRYWISRGCTTFILPEEQFDLTIFWESTENGRSCYLGRIAWFLSISITGWLVCEKHSLILLGTLHAKYYQSVIKKTMASLNNPSDGFPSLTQQ